MEEGGGCSADSGSTTNQIIGGAYLKFRSKLQQHITIYGTAKKDDIYTIPEVERAE